MNIKRIIAREGLIILSCIGWVVLLIGISLFMPVRDMQYIYSVTTGGHKYELTVEGEINVSEVTDKEKSDLFQAIVTKHPEDFDKAGLSKMPSDAFPIDIKIQYERKLIDWKNFSFMLGIWSLLVYPVYLLFRFVIWAIKTLSEVPKN